MGSTLFGVVVEHRLRRRSMGGKGREATASFEKVVYHIHSILHHT